MFKNKYFEEKQISAKQSKFNQVITYQIEHETISINPTLGVALVKFETTMRNFKLINEFFL